jgi:hypothetical protein
MHSQDAGKLDPHARKCIFVGYSSTKKGYKYFDHVLKRSFISCDVRFDDNQIFYKKQGQQNEFQGFQIPIVAPLDLEPSTQQSRDNLGPKSVDLPEAPITIDLGMPEEADRSNNEEVIPRRSTRASRPPSKLRDFITFNTTEHPIQSCIRYDKVSSIFLSFLTTIENNHEPVSFEEAKKNDIWINAMKEELQALEKKSNMKID